ncbi:polysaccharide pyruvyl transferase family protein [Saccharothrix luteola]|uniref:polysaccharide pyruvyl transferase family protein n=1 Tax=Saccharothrix luteola TaxID=2893018 RepID=UPI001E3C8633|nr:polysaccharide pyruvyl transferase family protein [Saccharothrix luteola]MCC8247091.1 polysaccharide pyruvyl transferase family protein [Saccharothrix luteola]MCC8249868.1 polysaccharide pyruvyl transferase family protein [Saccharothrix luteola]
MTAEVVREVPARRRARLRSEITRVLSALLAPGTPCALVDFPLYANVGDSAIWSGERAVLRELGVPVAYTCDERSFRREDLLTVVPEGVILLQGGGNLGDLWPERQRFREHVIRSFPRHRIVQLPQSICFRDEENLRRARDVFDAHPDLTLLVRDRHSLQLARTHFAATSLLCPDMVFTLPTPATTGHRAHDVVWLARSDHEATGLPRPAPRGRTLHTDWADELGAAPAWRLRREAAGRRLRAAVHAVHARPGPESASAVAAAHDELAALQLTRGIDLLAGDVVVTDRLHGHLLCLLLDRPHVLLADRYDKIENTWRTWTSGWPGVRWAGSPDEAVEQARALATTAGARK